MKTTEELIAKISPRYKKAREKKLDFLWEDFLKAVEKAIKLIPDDKLSATTSVTILYFTREGDTNIYRSKVAEYSFFHEGRIEYEKENICLGTREMLELAFNDFREKAKKDKNLCVNWFNVEEFEFDHEGESEIKLDFILPKEL